MSSLSSRFSRWVLVHPVMWAVGSGVTLALVGFAFSLAPVVIVAVGAVIAVVNIVHARRQGYCPVPKMPDSRHRMEIRSRTGRPGD